jgi:hypothetical protein
MSFLHRPVFFNSYYSRLFSLGFYSSCSDRWLIDLTYSRRVMARFCILTYFLFILAFFFNKKSYVCCHASPPVPAVTGAIGHDADKCYLGAMIYDAKKNHKTTLSTL